MADNETIQEEPKKEMEVENVSSKASDAEINFGRLRKKNEEVQRLLQQEREAREKIEREVEELRREREARRLESELYLQEDSEDPDEFVSSKKIKEIQKRSAKAQANILTLEMEKMKKETETLSKKIKEELLEETKIQIRNESADEQLKILANTYGAKSIESEINNNNLLRAALDGRPKFEQAQILKEFFDGKREAQKLMTSDNSNGTVKGTGISSNASSLGNAETGLSSNTISAVDLFSDPAKLKEFVSRGRSIR